MEISVIIPALNEAASIGAVLRSIGHPSGVEVIVVDGGSTDDTAKIAEAYDARVIRSAAGRAHQMNVGAAAARGNILIFLHADTLLPRDFLQAVEETLFLPRVVLGAFRLHIDSKSWSLRIIQMFANLRSRWLKTPNGDQALFVRRRHFRTAAGFADLPILEDLEFVRRMARWGQVGIAKEAVVTSARRWERFGILRTTLLNQLITVTYLLGFSPPRLAHWYRSGMVSSDGSRKNPEMEPMPGMATPSAIFEARRH